MFINSLGSIGFSHKNYQKNYQKNYSSNNTLKSTPIKPMANDSVSFGHKLPLEEAVKLFDNYAPKVMDFGGYSLPVHNTEIAKRLKPSYTLEAFKSLFAFAKKKGVYDLHIDPKTNFVQTSLIDAKENPLMSKLIWVTDSSNYMPILKDRYPESCVPLMENMSKYCAKQQRAFDKIINDPLLFELNHDWPGTAKQGVGHVFNPKSGYSHKWFARTRLDSMGLYLQTMTDLISNGFKGKKYGYKNAAQVSNETIESIANSTSYLHKIKYPYAKDTGAWEEKTFNATTSSDVAIINQAFRNILDLMYSPTKDKEVLAVRKRLLNAKNGEIFKDEKSLREMLEIGEYRINTNSSWEVPNERELDGAMSFIFHTENLDKDTIKNAEKILLRLDRLEKGSFGNESIVRENGVLRYIHDTYLHLNYDLVENHEYNASYRKFLKNTEAQWFMAASMSKAYGTVVQKLLDMTEKEGSTSKLNALLKKAFAKQTEYMNRDYARITGKNTYKANAVACPPFQIPEAYQAVTDSKGNIKYVPGAHTPLAWAQSESYDAAKLMEENLARMKALKIQ